MELKENSTPEASSQQSAEAIFKYAAHLLIDRGQDSYDAKKALMARGVDEVNAALIIDRLEEEIESAKKKAAQKDMLWGAVWCIGGTVATLANFGFVFWGAIVFGGIQFFQGVYKYSNS
jgi:hypothetical protein